ncbi:uncharacterized protein MYCFIDRAFT_178979 [Pseudocercospora fijiensis CIRAD86]|uniref:Uncharacterized protein n=1 Tax=Pseudocercospora fijiensis (strain CIRAD86) TaxID=383855 RepID=M3AP49_PSEFD|nr:uncharacterized protein MYCFIDRAFT_178979 [Pseudocercospora fijiensis CIRAD86]EME78893.1 hypothetical protein MYCFIDRAFT_178979 [Pseudocercospora fijiensis CIRAD86]
MYFYFFSAALDLYDQTKWIFVLLLGTWSAIGSPDILAEAVTYATSTPYESNWTIKATQSRMLSLLSDALIYREIPSAVLRAYLLSGAPSIKVQRSA